MGAAESANNPVTLPFTREYIDICVEEDGHFEVALGSVSTRFGNYTDETAQFVKHVDALLNLCGIEPGNWLDHVSEVRQDLCYGTSPQISSGNRLRAAQIEGGAGEFIHDKTFWAMPMEGELDGEGSATLSLHLNEAMLLQIIGKGSYWRERFYLETGKSREEALKDIHDTLPYFSEIGDEDEPEYLGYEDGHSISFKGRIALKALETAELTD